MPKSQLCWLFSWNTTKNDWRNVSKGREVETVEDSGVSKGRICSLHKIAFTCKIFEMIHSESFNKSILECGHHGETGIARILWLVHTNDFPAPLCQLLVPSTFVHAWKKMVQLRSHGGWDNILGRESRLSGSIVKTWLRPVFPVYARHTRF